MRPGKISTGSNFNTAVVPQFNRRAKSAAVGTEVVRGKVTLLGVAEQAIYLNSPDPLELPRLTVAVSAAEQIIHWDDRKLTADDVAEYVDVSTALNLTAAEWISLAIAGAIKLEKFSKLGALLPLDGSNDDWAAPDVALDGYPEFLGFLASFDRPGDDLQLRAAAAEQRRYEWQVATPQHPQGSNALNRRSPEMDTQELAAIIEAQLAVLASEVVCWRPAGQLRCTAERTADVG